MPRRFFWRTCGDSHLLPLPVCRQGLLQSKTRTNSHRGENTQSFTLELTHTSRSRQDFGHQASRNKCIASSNKCLTSSNKCHASRNNKLLETSASLLATSVGAQERGFGWLCCFSSLRLELIGLVVWSLRTEGSKRGHRHRWEVFTKRSTRKSIP